ncbi:MAG TPA: hypothetical protein VGF30_03300 [Bacteroidia bacterium]
MKTIKTIFLAAFKKLLEVRKDGLYKYRNYLFAQLEYAGQSEIRSRYKKYVQEQLELNDRQLQKVDSKLKQVA